MAESETERQSIVIYWTLYHDNGGSVSCELSRTGQGLWVRCIDQAGVVMLSERVGNAAIGAEVAAEWRERLLRRKEYFERPSRIRKG